MKCADKGYSADMVSAAAQLVVIWICVSVVAALILARWMARAGTRS